MKHVKITCKDPKLTEYLTQEYGGKFQHAYEAAGDGGAPDIDFMIERFEHGLQDEARKQEWYDYADDPAAPGGRRVLHDADGNPKLIPIEVSFV